MKRIIYHWSGGAYSPNSVDKEHYHYIIDNKGVIYNGKFKPENNLHCNQNAYAAHTGGGNTASIGIAFAGMYGFNSRFNTGNYPLTKIQCERGFELGAKLIIKYGINISDKMSVQTHYGFGQRNPKTSSYGKIDIIYLPPYPDIEKDKVEDFIRNKVIWYINKLNRVS